MSPVIAGLVLSILISIVTSWVSSGEAPRRGYLATPEEIDPPAVLQQLNRALATSAPARRSDASALERVIKESEVRSVHLELLPAAVEPTDLGRQRLKYLRLKYEHEGVRALTGDEICELLFSPATIVALSAAFAAPATTPAISP
ncbi:MAG: hypothetical protein U1E76_24915 [Planctomycetota bacterium]